MMTPDQIELDAACRRHGISDSVRDRIVRLNPKWDKGKPMRGWHPTRGRRFYALTRGMISKGDFIREHGRKAWESLPNGLKWKDGRARYVNRRMVLDNLWMLYAGLIPPLAMTAWYPTKRYANDNDLTVEYIPPEEFQRRLSA